MSSSTRNERPFRTATTEEFPIIDVGPYLAGENGALETLADQFEHAVTGVQSAGKGEYDFFSHQFFSRKFAATGRAYRLSLSSLIIRAFCTCRRFSASSMATQ